MSTFSWKRYAGWAALAAGSILLLAILFTILFFTSESLQGEINFGFLSDSIPIVAHLLALVVVIYFFQLERNVATPWKILIAMLGIAGYLVVVVADSLFVLRKIELDGQIQSYFLSLGPLGLWQVIVSSMARRRGLLSTRLTTTGIWLGAAELIVFVVFFLFNGFNATVSSNFETIMTNYPLLIMLVIGFPASLFAYFGAPGWLIWLGRVLLRGEEDVNRAD